MNISLICGINKLGYGQTGKNFLKALTKLGHNVALWPINQISQNDIDTDDIPYIKSAVSNVANYDSKAPCIRIWHQHDLAQFVGRGPHIGFPIFELDTFRPIEKHHMSQCDALFVCSQWAKTVVIKNGINVPTFVVPLGVDTDIFNPEKYKKQEDGKTIFFNCGKWEYRKGHDIIITAFNLAFNKDDDVELWMLCNNPFLTPERSNYWVNMYMQSELGIAGKIKILPRIPSNDGVAEIMSQTDCGVFPARAEGWNLELLEMMALGKQVITTDYAAHTEFCTPSNSLLFKPNQNEVAYDEIWFSGEGNWAEITDDDIYTIADMMKTVHNNKTVNIGGIETGKRFSWMNSASKLIKHLENL